MDAQTESQASARQLRLHRAALWQAGVALLCTGLVIVRPALSLQLASLERLWQVLAIAFYAAHMVNIYRLAVAQGYSGTRTVLWLVVLAPLASPMALAFLKPVAHSQQVAGSTAGGI
jgi:hypothetical protein